MEASKLFINTFRQINWQYCLFLVVATLWSVLMFGLPDFFDNPLEGIGSYLSIAAYLVVISIVVFPLMMFMTASRKMTAVLLPLYGLLGAVVAYYRVAFHATVTVIMIDAVLNTNASEAAGVMSWGLFGYVALNLALAIALVVWRYRIGLLGKRLVWLVVGLLGVLVAYNGNERVMMSIVQRYPFNIFYYGKEYYSFMLMQFQPRELLPVEEVAPAPDSLTVVFVLGESIRSDHLSINGYERETMPLMSTEENVITMGDVWMPYTNTGSAVPYLLTPADEDHRDWAQTRESFIPYYKDRGFYTTWISNQDMGNGYSHFIRSVDERLLLNAKRSVWTFDTWTDKDLIKPFQESLSEGRQKNLYVLHTIGAHWYYNLHYTEDLTKFTPVTTSRVVTKNPPENVINSYDNCVVCMDYLVHSLARMLADRKAIIVYQSDHGEGLGENGAWLHASEGERMHHPAGFVWYSDSYKEAYPDVIAELEAVSAEKKDAAYVFPLMLRIVGLALTD